MIRCDRFFCEIDKLGIDFFTGVPDSTLKDFCAYLVDNIQAERHIIAANEGGAIALACGHYLASGKPGLVYMQNSGLGNAFNPLVSLADPLVYGIPLLLVVGFRGEPGGAPDEPQHAKQGRITLPLFGMLGIDHDLLPDNIEAALAVLERARKTLSEGKFFALVVRPGIFEKYKTKESDDQSLDIGREEAIIAVCKAIGSDSVIVSTTGHISRELYEYREKAGEPHSSDFLTVGSMGHSSQIALGIALCWPQKNVYCFDGDGSIIMHMGSLAINGQAKPPRFRHIVFNNGAHVSVGGQKTVGFEIDIPAIAKASGYKNVSSVRLRSGLEEKIRQLMYCEGPALLEIKVSKSARGDLGRPKHTPQEIKRMFMANRE